MEAADLVYILCDLRATRLSRFSHRGHLSIVRVAIGDGTPGRGAGFERPDE